MPSAVIRFWVTMSSTIWCRAMPFVRPLELAFTPSAERASPLDAVRTNVAPSRAEGFRQVIVVTFRDTSA